MERAVNELSQVIISKFTMHPARMACFLGMIWGVIAGKKVQLWSIAEQFGGSALLDSRIKRISRFLAHQALCLDAVARCITTLISVSGPWTVVIDRSNWQFGKLERNYLVLAIVHQGNAVPLLFHDLERAGNSSTDERIKLLERFLKLFGREKIFCVLADREFIGEDWFKWLLSNDIKPCIRTRNNTQIRHRNGGRVPVKNFLRDLQVGEYRTWDERLFGAHLRMIGLKLTDGNYLVLLAHPELDVELLPLYKLRWSIECLFKNAKSSGFDWEKTHLTHADRALKLLAILALATALAVKEGALQHAAKPIPHRKTVNAQLLSLFTYGLRSLSDSFRNYTMLPNHKLLIINHLHQNVR